MAMRLHSLGLLVCACLAAVASHVPAALAADAPSGQGQVASLPAQTDSQGQVIVKAQPLSRAPDGGWRFEIQMNTHVVPLDQDLLSTASLSDAEGRAVPPSDWQGDPPGGHHRKGVLSFPPTAATRSVTLKLDQSGPFQARSFTWILPAP